VVAGHVSVGHGTSVNNVWDSGDHTATSTTSAALSLDPEVADLRVISERLKESAMEEPDNYSWKQSLAHALAGEGRLDEAISVWWELVDATNSSDLGILFELYKANCQKYGRKVILSFTSHLRFILLYCISMITRRWIKIGIATGVDWRPIVERDDLMMLEPFMRKEHFEYV